jgi:hypothetical protein
VLDVEPLSGGVAEDATGEFHFFEKVMRNRPKL